MMIEIRQISEGERAEVEGWADPAPEDLVIIAKGQIIAVADDYLTVTLSPVADHGLLNQTLRNQIEDGLSALADIYADLK
jgi:hypothetical protein